MTDIFIIHGAFGYPNENWFPWLKKELEKLCCKVFVPEFPTPKNQTLNNWLDTFKNYKKYIDESSIFVGHSLGCAFILNVLETINVKIKAAFFVAGFISSLNNDYFDTINKTFINKNFDLLLRDIKKMIDKYNK